MRCADKLDLCVLKAEDHVKLITMYLFPHLPYLALSVFLCHKENFYTEGRRGNVFRNYGKHVQRMRGVTIQKKNICEPSSSNGVEYEGDSLLG
jgi:hypothetical protein